VIDFFNDIRQDESQYLCKIDYLEITKKIILAIQAKTSTL